MTPLIRKIENEFKNHFTDEFILVKSPGRVNLIGEHTDYNEGFVLPAAINMGIVLALAPNGLDKARLVAMDMDDSFEIDISGEIPQSEKVWPNYLLGVVDQLRKSGYSLEGFDCVFGGDIPIGAGLSSSAALEGGVLFGLATLFDLNIPPVEMARIAQKAENDFVGVQCGIMDQFVSLNGRAGQALKLDCRSLDHEYYPFNNEDIRIVLCDTGIRRELATSEYNIRRKQCEKGVSILQGVDPDIDSLRDVELAFLFRYKDKLAPDIFKRCKYVIEENKRVLQACSDLQQDDLTSFGHRMYQSHLGLRIEYEVSCKELDTLVDIAQDQAGVLGARMMGGGFGGCTINLVENEQLQQFKKQIKSEYEQQLGQSLSVYDTKVSQGTHLLTESELTSIQ
ncbi:galactokinase [Fodinibius halophilus]|uniref:Galactokinase n=1 Tax=Fodinibius halophilus TaxID=1736908 RepID=A0A6M1TE78_9BACT|nr:galactokinase [Fodinibius halophilus]NGP89064.1 galactokinase [Fodinibius halophilus]